MIPFPIDDPVLLAALGFAVGTLVTGTIAFLVGRRRAAARHLRWESRFHALEAETAGARLDLASVIGEKRGLSADLAGLHQTLALLRTELESQRSAVDEAVAARELAARRADAAVGEVARHRLLLEEAIAERDERDARFRELKPLTDQRTSLAARIGEMGRAMAEIESDRTRLALLVETQQHQLRQALDSTRQEQERLEAGRSLMSTQLRDRQRQIEEGKRTIERIQGELADARARLLAESARAAEAESALRAADLRHQESIARLASEHGGLEAQVERLEPLRRQLADREELIRSIARERDDAATALVRRERELQAEVERLTGALAEATRRVTQARERDGRIAELEARLAAALREAEQLRTAEQTARTRADTLAAEVKERDLRFRALLDDRRTIVESAQEEAGRLRNEIDRIRQTRRPEDAEGPAAGLANGNGAGGDHPIEAEPIANGNGSEAGAGSASPDDRPSPAEASDDLEKIVGIGPAIARALRSRGVVTFRQIAAWSDADIDRYSTDLGAFKNRIRRDRWVEQARREHEQAYGERLDR